MDGLPLADRDRWDHLQSRLRLGLIDHRPARSRAGHASESCLAFGMPAATAFNLLLTSVIKYKCHIDFEM